MVTDDEVGQPGRAAVPGWPGEDFVCEVCSLAYAELSMETAAEMIRALPSTVRAATQSMKNDELRRHVAPGTWSVLEYVCHLRDVYASYTIRLHRARTEDRPALEPMLNDLRARRFGYNDLRLEPVLEELAATAAGCQAEIARLGPTHWQRLVVRLPGEQRSTRWLVRQAAHEGQHHLHDIQRMGREPAGEP